MEREQGKRALVRRLARAGVPEHRIAFKLGISLETLRTFFGEDIEREKAVTKPVVRFIVRDKKGKILHDTWLG